MNNEDLRTKIVTVFEDVYAKQNGGEKLPEMQDDTVLLETGIDSLGFAIIVTQLEMVLGIDPFSAATEAYYPQNFKEFVDFYAKHMNA